MCWFASHIRASFGKGRDISQAKYSVTGRVSRAPLCTSRMCNNGGSVVDDAMVRDAKRTRRVRDRSESYGLFINL